MSHSLRNHKKLLDKIFDSYNHWEINEENIKSFHFELMQDPLQWEYGDAYNLPGQYRMDIRGAFSKNNTWKEYMEPAAIHLAMRNFVRELNVKIAKVDIQSNEFHPIKIVSFAHQHFLGHIHPFSDGNGRVGRLLIAMILMKNGLPPFFPKDRDRYIDTLFRTTNENLDPLTDFISDTLLESMNKQLYDARK